MTSDALKCVLTTYRKSHAQRFRHDRDWLRLSILASCLLACSVLAFTDALASAGTASVVLGSPAIFGGLTIAIFITKIARAEIYADWILSAALYIGVGFSLLVDEARGEALAQVSFPTLLIAAGAVRIWIGLTVEPESAAVWLCFSGCVALASGLVTLAGSAFAIQIPLRTILAVDLLFLGISIARFSVLVRGTNVADRAGRQPKEDLRRPMSSASKHAAMRLSPLTADPRSPSHTSLDQAIGRGLNALLGLQRDDGHWVFVLEADATIPAEYILLKHFIGVVDRQQETKLAAYLRSVQSPEHGGWQLWHGGPFDISASVKAYFALKAAGDDPDAPHMARARTAILDAGGAARSNVFTRILLALFEQVPWRAVPVMPVQIMVLPAWFPFHLNKVSYWSRTVIVPLLVIMAKKPRPANPGVLSIQELMVQSPRSVKNWHVHVDCSLWGKFFRRLDGVLRLIEPFFPWRQKSIRKAVDFVTERLNGEDGLGAIYPAMANAVMMFKCLGYPDNYRDLMIACASVEKLVDTINGVTYVQPCLSPVWDTALTAHALFESGDSNAAVRARRGLDWLVGRQVLNVKGDWAERRPDVRPGGWAFQYNNPHYPDLDDTSVVVMAMHRADPIRYHESIARGVEWILGLQSSDGGWAAFEVDNAHYYLNHVPFADHGALLDPPTADVTARCLGVLGQIGRRIEDPAVEGGMDFLRRAQEADGSWFGRSGTNCIYGTCSVLCAFNAIELEPEDPAIRRAVAWLLSQQRKDGGWGETGDSYYVGKPEMTPATSTASQTAWALLGLMAAGEVGHPAVARGITYLLAHQREGGLWDEPSFTAVGFPGMFYLRYHGYPAFFPIWALSRYRHLRDSKTAITENRSRSLAMTRSRILHKRRALSGQSG